MNVQEELEAAFIAGANFAIENTNNWEDNELEFPIETEIMKAADSYTSVKTEVK